MNPYQPPQCIEPAEEVAGPAVMLVRHSLAYSIYLTCLGILCVVLGFFVYQLTRLASVLFVVSGIAHLALGMLVRKRAYFEVFEDRLEFLSPIFPRWRSVKPVASIGARSFHRWISKREDFARFIAWREGELR